MVGVRCKPYGSKEYLYQLRKFARVAEDPTHGPEHTFLDKKRFVVVSYDPVEGYALLFDSATTIYMKMCLSYTVQGSVPFGLALFDAEYDDWSKKGDKAGSFPLTRSARKVVDDIKDNSADDSAGPMECVALE
ncbi:uncharacterized protein LOC119382721 [Rhipicephalus sanguineus]|uniref:uncharacterized protein LOC119382721 n=1 Tax=Rhipicephalus sanguineus TaxID=34632 RepID=UPI0020C2760D|nr:uncharacterized protein LOC119382721 [Rhipicephalus sanguineus]